MAELNYAFPETRRVTDAASGIIRTAMGIPEPSGTQNGTTSVPAGTTQPATSTATPAAGTGSATSPASNTNGTPGLVPNANSTGYTPAQVNLSAPTDTVEGRIGNILHNDSPLLQDARTRAAQTANKRGLINSSMAVGEGEKAVIQTALPIVSQDANAAVQTAYRNQDATNTASQTAATAENAYNQQQLAGAQAMEQQQLRGEQSVELANIEAQYKQQLQSSQSATQFFSQITAGISDILKEPNIGVEQKAQLVQKQIDMLRNGLTVIGSVSNLDLTSLLTFPEIPPAQSLSAEDVQRLRDLLSNPSGGYQGGYIGDIGHISGIG
jgi:ethanolamine utilization protein EutP (predicted NTPase)